MYTRNVSCGWRSSNSILWKFMNIEQLSICSQMIQQYHFCVIIGGRDTYESSQWTLGSSRGTQSTICLCFILLFDILVYLLIIFNVMLFTFYKVAPKTAKAIHQFLVKLRAYAKGKSAFTFILDDPAGNSFIENP